MKPHERRLLNPLCKDLSKKMVILAGPRQCGKTTLAKQILSRVGGSYYSWDILEQRALIRKQQMDTSATLWVFDELHKNRHWRNWLKGVFDEYHAKHAILVTGSARLELYGRGGDSLQGRYFQHHLHPFTLAEAQGLPDPELKQDAFMKCENSISRDTQNTLHALHRLGGFPEPFFGQSDMEASRWRLSYGARLVQEDIRTLESVMDLEKMELLFERLPATVGSVLSINSLREDLEVAFGTAKKWILIFEKIYGVFRINPFGPAKLKAVKKEPKLYFWDWARVPEPSARFENLVAAHLMSFCHWMEDLWGQKCELRFFRTSNGHEVDFIVLKQGRPWFAVEAKTTDRPLDPNLRYLLEHIQIPRAFQISLDGKLDFEPSKINSCAIRVLPAARFLCHLT